MFETIIQDNPNQEVNFWFVVELLKEVKHESLSFNLKLDYFVEVFYHEVNNSEYHSVWYWLHDMYARFDRASSFVLSKGSIDLSSFAEEVEEVEDYLTESIND